MRRRSLVLAAAAFAALSGLAEAAESRLKRILDSGVLRVGTTGDWNPMTIRDPASNSYKGYDIDMLSEMAADLGVKVEFVATDWKTIVQGIVADKYDITGSASMSPARAKVAGFSEPYFELATVPLTLKKNAGRFKDWGDIDAPDVVAAATLGTVQESQVKQFFPKAKHKIVEAPARDFQEVLAGRADVNITSNVEAATLVERYPELMVVPVKEARLRTPIAMLLPQDDQVWINYVNHWIRLKRARGYFAELAERWRLANE
jgi:cyclohexadienyl dehydratase